MTCMGPHLQKVSSPYILYVPGVRNWVFSLAHLGWEQSQLPCVNYQAQKDRGTTAALSILDHKPGLRPHVHILSFGSERLGMAQSSRASLSPALWSLGTQVRLSTETQRTLPCSTRSPECSKSTEQVVETNLGSWGASLL